ncbi:nitroreductase family protein [Streptomyces sp. NBC_00838]|uniref:Acg family FMN-binding oxidoreductase n=1 Tax=Streptomyces sp. NBC_00838 TaxID=2903680 RepID=UPI0038670934|nr:nitroreductase family protein [Streptomyces sp. NBC_00838]
MSVQTIDELTVTGLVSDATAAPSMHNAQPWLFRYAPGTGTITMSADLSRAMPHEDRDGRGLHVGCGAALLNLRVALARLGRRCETTLLPDASAPQLLATVRIGSPTSGDALAELYPAIRERHTSRFPFAEREIPQALRDTLGGAARLEGAGLTFPSGPHLRSVLDLIEASEGYDLMDPDRNAERAGWTRNSRADAGRDGVPDYAFGPRKRGGTAPARDFAGLDVVKGRPMADFEDRPQLALLSTAADGPADWLRAGQALERVLLVATSHGLTSSFATQALERSDLRWLLRDPVSGTGHVQMVLRLGYGPRGPRTPRRSVHEVLTIED